MAGNEAKHLLLVNNTAKTIYHYGLNMRIQKLGKSTGCQEAFYKKDALKNFANLTGIHLCRSLFLNKVPDLQPATSLKRNFSIDAFQGILQKFKSTNLVEPLQIVASDQTRTFE